MTIPSGDIDMFIQIARDEKMSFDDLSAYCWPRNVSLSDLCNQISLTVARRFDKGLLPFEDADAVMNALFSAVIMNEASPQCLPEPANSVVLAFDDGEYVHEDGVNPIEKYTIPSIKAILAKETADS